MPSRIRVTAGGIIVNPEGRIVLVLQSGGAWSFPKGGVKEGEELLAGAYREIYEETGIRKEQLEYQKAYEMYERLQINDPEVTKHMYMYLFHTDYTGPLAPTLDEGETASWLACDEVLENLFHEKDIAFFKSIKHEL